MSRSSSSGSADTPRPKRKRSAQELEFNRRASGVFRDMPLPVELTDFPNSLGSNSGSESESEAEEREEAAVVESADATSSLETESESESEEQGDATVAVNPKVQHDAYFQELQKFSQRDTDQQVRVGDAVNKRLALEKSFGTNMPNDLKTAITNLADGIGERSRALKMQGQVRPEEVGKNYDYTAGNSALDKIHGALDVIDAHFKTLDKRNKFDARADRVRKLVAGINNELDDVPDTLAKQVAAYRKDTKDGLDDTTDAETNNDVVAGNTALDKVEKAVADFQKARLLALRPGSKKARALLEPMLADTATARLMLEDQSARVALDTVMKDLGDTAKSAETKEFVTNAIKARFNIDELKGEMTTKALPKFYELMTGIPLEHTKANEKLKTIERHKTVGQSDALEGHMRINAGRAGKWKGKTAEFDQDKDVLPECKIKSKEVRKFDQTTLHEIGHTVDEGPGFMNGKLGNAKYGGWQKHQLNDVLKIAYTGTDFIKDLGNKYPPSFLREYLRQVLITGKDPKDKLAGLLVNGADLPARDDLLADPGVKLAEEVRARLKPDRSDEVVDKEAVKDAKSKIVLTGLGRTVAEAAVTNILDERLPLAQGVDDALSRYIPAEDGAPDWTELLNHDAVDWCQQVRLVGDNGMWEKGEKAAKKYAIGDRVYHQSQGQNWVSYPLAVRKRGVSSYQFRSPAEWFAELYAAYYMGKLSDSHPDAKWLKTEVHEPQDA